jgi:hypothetical protein
MAEAQPAEAGTIESRQHPRYAVDGEAEVTVADGASLLRGRIHNLSISGCYIKSLALSRLTPGTPVEILFKLHAENIGLKILRVRAEARFSKPKIGIGFRFIGLDTKQDETIAAILNAAQT